MAVTAQVNVKIDSTQAEKTVGKLNETISNSAKSANSLRAELRQTIQELQNLQPGTARFQELSVRAGELREQIQDTNAVVNQLAGNFGERLAKGISNVVGIGIAGFQGITGAMAVFGNESEDLTKTMVKLQGLLNLTQALETLSGIPDKFTEIKAAFQSLTTATQAQAVATETEAAAQTAANIATETGVVATNSLTVATGALGVAMKALPIIGLVASLGALAYAGYEYATSNSKAEESEKRRIATLKAQREEQDKQNESIAKESAGFVSLIYQLKATNAGSKERATLIKQINATYGTTLKNLKDETAFQQSLNAEIANYIVYQKAKFQLQKNEELVQRNLIKQEELTKQLTLAQKLLAAEEEKARNFRQDDKTAGQVLQNIQDYNKEVKRLQGELQAAEKRLQSYGKVSVNANNVINEITGGTNKYTEATNANTDAKDKNVEATEEQITAQESLEAQLQNTNKEYTDTLKFIQDLVDISQIDTPTPKIIDDILKVVDARNALEDKTLQDVFKELGIGVSIINGSFGIFTDKLQEGEDAFGVFYEGIRKTLATGAVDQSIIDFGNTVNKFVDDASIKLNEGIITKEAFDVLVTITNQYEKFNQLINLTPGVFDAKKLKPFFDATKEIGIATDIINFEKVNGDLIKIEQQTVKLSEAQQKQKDAIAGFQQDLETFYKKQIAVGQSNYEESVKNGDFTEEQQKKLLEGAKLGIEEQKKLIAEIAKAQVEGVANIVTTVVEEENQIRDFLAQSIELRKNNLKEIDDLVKKALLNNTDLLIKETQKSNAIVLDLNKTAQENLNSFQQQMSLKNIDLTKYTEEEKLKLVKAYLDAQKDAVAETEMDKLQKQLDAVDDYLASFQSLYSDFESALTNVTEQESQKRTQAIQDSLDQQTALLDAQLAQRLITQQEYDNQVLQLQQQQEQQQREIAKKSFQRNKRLNLVGATIDGARAVLATFKDTQGDVIIRTIAAALAAAFAATQIAVIAKSSFQAATGGIVPGMGSGEIDSVSANLAPGEAVINKKSTDQFLPILDAINQAGGGRSLMPNLPATNQGQKFEVVFPDNKQQQPVRAYVVEADITDAQKRVNRIENSTRF